MSKLKAVTPKQVTLFVATPMYGGMCAGAYAQSLLNVSSILQAEGHEVLMSFMFNESLIPRARNALAQAFMKSDATHMMFIDSDIGFDPRDVLALLALQSDDSEYDVLAGPYPKKCISWEKIKLAVDKGIADEDPNVLEKFVGDYVFNPKGGITSFRIDEPIQVGEVGTGFMMVKRSTYERFRDSYPQFSYKPDHVRTEHFDGSREIMMYFQAEIEPESKRYLSEDYWFCHYLQKAGGKIWYCPWMRLQHVGSYIFGGSLADLASIGAPATADPSMLKKNRS